ncbi:hypothetical protein [Photorhabdus heterorhabditis]|uniref:Oligosaccharide repeat unit polymerase n=1 Tax=Photorhabdus heterorhabditis TaxID=880156 RepID=A0A5B0X622_9GAMM|nr:hypothetical protein [Photorhabdus heterorhabditis]KAA1194766.1 hypothetical protein F0L16_05380 [Photorhabdus heterorhabditis]
MPQAVIALEIIYVSLILVSILFSFSKKIPLLDTLFVVLVLLSPYSISIIPFRQDTINNYNLYSNYDILNIINFYKVLSLSPLDYLCILIFCKNINQIINTPKFFLIYFTLITLVGIISYYISSIVLWSDELDNITRIIPTIKPVIYILSLYSSIFKICKTISLYNFILLFLSLSSLYFISSAIILNFLPTWYTWVKYGANYLFLDQTDQFIAFLFIVITIFIPIPNKYKIIALIIFSMLIISGAKAFIYSLIIIILSYFCKNFNLKISSAMVLFFSAIIISWGLSLVIGINKWDTSIYTRYFQVHQLIINYSSEKILIFFGIGPYKAYRFFAEPELFDSGAYISKELSTMFRIGFQMPYLSWIKNYGLSGVFFIIISSKYVISHTKKAFSINRNFGALNLSLGIYFILVCCMDYPAFGIKTLLPIAIYIYMQKMENKHNGINIPKR